MLGTDSKECAWVLAEEFIYFILYFKSKIHSRFGFRRKAKQKLLKKFLPH